jgi:acyl-CoA hydrolase
MGELAARLSALLPPGGRLAVGDGAGCPLEVWAELSSLLVERRDISVLLGWWFTPPPDEAGLDAARALTIISGFGMRRSIDEGRVGFVPSRMSQAPVLLAGPLRCDLLVTSLRPSDRGFAFSTEVAWERAVLDSGAKLAAVLRHRAPATQSGPELSMAEVLVVAESDEGPLELAGQEPSERQRGVAEKVAALVPDEARIQVGPGGLGAAVFAALERPVAIDTGIITDGVLELDRRGLLIGRPLAPYVAGGAELYDWVAGRVDVERCELTHDIRRLSTGRPMVAVNTCLEIDLDGQVNAEVAAGSWAGGVGGQPDFALGASLSPGGLSIMALASTRAGGAPTLVEQLSGPVTTTSFDIDVVVTERGSAELRGLSRQDRRRALAQLWGSEAP